MAIHKDSIVDVDLTSGTIHRSFLNHSIGMNDSDGDFFGVRVFKSGVPVDLTNVSVQGHFNPPVGAPIFLNAGNYISGNVATVRLPQACYNYEGPFSLAIKLVTVNETVTVRIVDGMVDNTYVEGSVAPTGTVPTYQEVLAEYDQMVAATETANAAAQTAINTANTAAANCAAIVAAPYSNSATYAVGSYCTKDGKLYECTTAITTAEEWTAGHWTETKVGPEVSDLKSATNFNDYGIEETFTSTYTRSASIKAEDGTNGTTGFRTTYIVYTKPMKISFNKPGEKFVVWAYSNATADSGVLSPTKSYVTGTVYLPLISSTVKRFRIGFHKDNGGTYTEEEAAASFAAVEFRSQTDKTLLLENVPADAKITGEKTTENKANIDDIMSRMGRKNWFNPNDADVVEGQFISGVSSGSEVWTENANYGETGFIPVQQGDKITFFVAGSSNVSNLYKVYYNASKEPLDGSGVMPDNKYVTITDSSIKYIRVAFNLSRKTTFMVVKLTEQDATPYSPEGEVYVPYPNLTLPYIIKDTDQKINKAIENQWHGKSWYAYGTSITANNGSSGRNTYVTYLAGMSGLSATNNGIGGGGIGNLGAYSTGQVYDAICNITDGKLNADLITLETGANDINSDGTIPLGTIYDTGRNTLSGCLNDCLRYLQENTTAQIAVMPSPVSIAQRITEEHHQYYTWAAMVEEICRLNRVHFINSDNNMGYAKLSADSENLYIHDNIHQTNLGSYVMAENIWYQLRNIPLFRTLIPN